MLLGFFCLFFLANTGCASLKWKTSKKQTKLEETASSEQAKPKSPQKNQRATAGAGSLTRNILENIRKFDRKRTDDMFKSADENLNFQIQAILEKISEAARKRADDIFESINENLNFQNRNYQQAFQSWHGRLIWEDYYLRDSNNTMAYPFIKNNRGSIPFYENSGFNFKGSNFQEIIFSYTKRIPSDNSEYVDSLKKYLKYLKHGGDYDKKSYGFAGSNLTDANMRQTVAEFMSFEEALMIGTKMEEGSFAWSSFQGAELTEAVANRAILFGTNWTDAIMPGAKFNGAALIGARFSGENLDLRWTEFIGADLRGYYSRDGGSLPTVFDVDLET